jgi:hypothetical protein
VSALNCYGFGAVLAIALVFYFVRRIPAYLALCSTVVAAFVVGAWRVRVPANLSESILLALGLFLCVFGLLIVRVMLIRSVSLRLLRRLETGQEEGFSADVGARLHDMRAFGLIRTTGETSELRPFGRFIAGVVALLYAAFRIDT